MGGSGQLGNGNNWVGSIPYLAANSSEQIAATFDLCNVSWFDNTGNPLFGSHNSLTFNSASCQFELSTCDGNSWKFTPSGQFQAVDWNNATTTEVSEWTSEGRIKEITHSTTQNGKIAKNATVYEYIPADAEENAGLLLQITAKRSVNPTAGIRRTVYSYYSSGDEHGDAGDLRTATEQILFGTTWVDKDTHYYRYYKAGQPGGFAHGMKFALSPSALERLKQDPQVSDPFLAPDSIVAKYADNYYEYDSQQRVTKSIVKGGLHTYTYAYQTSAHSDDFNHWQLQIAETRPDGSQKITYNNYIGQTMLTEIVDGLDRWIEYHEFDDEAHEILHAMPSAVVSYDDGDADLGVVLKVAEGLIHVTEYYATTTATETVAGGVEGEVKSRSVKEGSTGTPVLLNEVTYFERVAGSARLNPIAESTAYRNDDGTGGITTSFEYTWFPSTTQMEQRTTKLPVVPSSQNGDGAEETITEFFDLHGHLIWQRDARGFINYREYDLATGALKQQIQDVDGAKLALPSGWSTLLGGGLHLVTDFEHDALGRITQTLGPSHDVNGQSVRTASWTVYKDLDDEVFSGVGYAVGTGPEDYLYTLVNPISIRRSSDDGRWQESVTAVRGSKSQSACDCTAPDAGTVESEGRLSASDCFPQSSWVRWSSSQFNEHKQLVSSRVYHTIPESGLGTLNVHYDETHYGYDLMGRQNRLVSPSGTITRTVFDARGQAVGQFVGTSDAYATDADPTGGGDPANNMVQTAAMEYDNGLSGGDGNLTQQTAYVDASTTRVTTYRYDFRNRRIATDGEVDFYQEQVYDNLDRVVRVDQRNTSTSGSLVARNETLFDDRGRVYQTLRYAVDPQTGTVGNSLVDNTWYDASGHVLCSLPSGAQMFTKNVYDGAGRQVERFVGYATDDLDPASVTGDIIFEQSETEYDAASNVLIVTSKQRYHNAAGQGALQGPTSSEPKSRDTYSALWCDGVGRSVASADFGTNDNAGLPERPTTPPTASDLVLVSLTRYNDRGEAFETVDPAGMVNRTYADAAGRTVRTIQNFVANVPCQASDNGSEG